MEKNTQEEPRDPLYPKQVGVTGGEARSCNPEEVKTTGSPPEVEKEEEPTPGDDLLHVTPVTPLRWRRTHHNM